MNFLQRIGNALSRFMYGRNGVDSLGWASLVAVLLLDTAELIVRSKNETAQTILATASFLLMVWTLFRMFSRNLPKRRSENAWFLTKIVNPLKSQRARSRDKDHKYFTCPKCGTSIHGKT